MLNLTPNTPGEHYVVNLGGTMEVHRVGCADLRRPKYRGQDGFTCYGDDEDQVLRDVWCDFVDEWDGDMSAGEDNTRFFPCVTFPKGSE